VDRVAVRGRLVERSRGPEDRRVDDQDERDDQERDHHVGPGPEGFFGERREGDRGVFSDALAPDRAEEHDRPEAVEDQVQDAGREDRPRRVLPGVPVLRRVADGRLEGVGAPGRHE
jgi:hypothetical protein